MSTVSYGNAFLVDSSLGPRVHTVFSALVLIWLMLSGSARAQSLQDSGDPADKSPSVHGRVLNRITHAPVTRALVFSPDQQYATLTDSDGRFEFKFPPQEPEPQLNPTTTNDPATFRGAQLLGMRNSRPGMFWARKPGFLDSSTNPSNGLVLPNQSEVVIYLDPESLIVGHVKIPALEAVIRVPLQLYRREVRDGQERWESIKFFTTWSDGEFRFCDLPAGTYKLGTDEQVDRDPFTFTPGGQLFGYPPVFYPGTADLSSAVPIQLGSGATFQASLAPSRREYYPVKIPIANGSAEERPIIRVYPLGHPGPGYSLGYNSSEQLIQGSLPNGNYTIQVVNSGHTSNGPPGFTGLMNFSVAGGPYQGPAIHLIPNTALTVAVKEDFRSGQSVFAEGYADSGDGSTPPVRRRQVNVQVTLTSIEEFGQDETAGSEQPQEPGTQEPTLVVPNVRPGNYHVHVETPVGYVASILSGETDLLHQPMVVAAGASIPPIEIMLRDDGAEVEGKVEEGVSCYVYFLPLDGASAQFRQTTTTPDGSFNLAQLPPGTYRVLAFDRPREDLAYTDADAMRKFESKGQLLHVEAGQKEHLRLKSISGTDAQ